MLGDWVRSEALVVDLPALVELVEVHEPLVAFVLVAARLVALCANITLASIITTKMEIMVFFKAPPCRTRTGLGIANRQRVLIALSQTAYFFAEQGWVIFP